jgi:hypothetical protein
MKAKYHEDSFGLSDLPVDGGIYHDDNEHFEMKKREFYR